MLRRKHYIMYCYNCNDDYLCWIMFSVKVGVDNQDECDKRSVFVGFLDWRKWLSALCHNCWYVVWIDWLKQFEWKEYASIFIMKWVNCNLIARHFCHCICIFFLIFRLRSCRENKFLWRFHQHSTNQVHANPSTISWNHFEVLQCFAESNFIDPVLTTWP